MNCEFSYHGWRKFFGKPFVWNSRTECYGRIFCYDDQILMKLSIMYMYFVVCIESKRRIHSKKRGIFPSDVKSRGSTLEWFWWCHKTETDLLFYSLFLKKKKTVHFYSSIPWYSLNFTVSRDSGIALNNPNEMNILGGECILHIKAEHPLNYL